MTLKLLSYFMTMIWPAARVIINSHHCAPKTLKMYREKCHDWSCHSQGSERRLLLFQGLLFLTYSAASHHRPFLIVWLRLTSVCLIYAKVKRLSTATPVKVKSKAVHCSAAGKWRRWLYTHNDYIFFGGSGQKSYNLITPQLGSPKCNEPMNNLEKRVKHSL